MEKSDYDTVWLLVKWVEHVCMSIKTARLSVIYNTYAI
jgi:hypothetical protein